MSHRAWARAALAALLSLGLVGLPACAGPAPGETGKADVAETPDVSARPAGDQGESVDAGGQEEAAPEPVDKVGERIASMTLDQKICQLLVVTPEALTGIDQVVQTGDTTRAALDATQVGGLIYFGPNLQDMGQSQAMLAGVNDHVRETGGIPLFLAVDEEGGDVARCAKALGTASFSPMYEYRDQGTQVAHDNARQIAEAISEVGFNTDLAPVADTWSNPDNVAAGTRAYDDDYPGAAEKVAAAVRGFHDGGVACSLKHFPGQGEALSDPHEGSIYSDKDVDRLLGEELVPFQAGIDAGADMVMVGHITMTAIDAEHPATLSRAVVTGLLREQMGYDGIVISDALNMGAITDLYSSTDAAVMALEAGCDIALMPTDLQGTIDAVRTAVEDGRIPEEQIDRSVRRCLEAKVERGIWEP